MASLRLALCEGDRGWKSRYDCSSRIGSGRKSSGEFQIVQAGLASSGKTTAGSRRRTAAR
jgi:hypothetical protein